VNQLRCAGMIEAIRISRAAYPYRMTHQDFVNRFAKLRPRALKRAKSARPLTMAEKCGAILRDICPDASGAKTSSGKAYELGVSKVRGIP
jgi:myosin-5